jgi:uncharacterized RDD family membrane protein YckC
MTWLVVAWLYFAVMESSAWQATIGKRIVGASVMDLTGERINFGRASIRYLAKLLCSVAWFVSALRFCGPRGSRRCTI